MYVCGITPYDATHLGHAATYVAFDLVYRQWLDAGLDVHYVQNVTDVDDPLLERANRDARDWRALADSEVDRYRRDMEFLRVLPPRELVSAVEAVPEIVEAVAKLLASGAAYRADDAEYPDVYYDHAASPYFGYESNVDAERMLELSANHGGDPDRKGKRHPLDALLWRLARPGEPHWDSELGAGRPGWHIECSVIALNRLGTGYDVQGGGSDLTFPHHEFSAAHAESLTAEHPMARHYCHAGMIGLDGEKMSKSKGNLVFVSALRAEGVDPMAVRLGVLAGHYRSDRSWSDQLLRESQHRLARWREAAALPAGPSALATVTRLREHLANDLDSPKALAAVNAWVGEALSTHGGDEDAPGQLRIALDGLLGIAL